MDTFVITNSEFHMRVRRMKKDEFLSIIKEKQTLWKVKLDQYNEPDHPEFYGILAKVSMLDYIISLANQLEC